jgi:hypothetical protein
MDSLARARKPAGIDDRDEAAKKIEVEHRCIIRFST